MTSTNVTQAANLLLNMPGVNMPGNTGNAGDDGFSKLMDRTSGQSAFQGQETANVQNAPKAPVKVEKTSIQNGGEKQSEELSKTQQKSPEEGDNTVEMDEAAEEALEEAAEDVKDAIEEELGISEEELEAIMSQLGLTQMDLLQPENMQAIVIAAAGELDDMSILTNETLYQNVQALTAQVEEIVTGVQSELAVDDETFAELLTQMEAVDAPEEMPELTDNTQEPVVVVSDERPMTSQLMEADGEQDPMPENTAETVRESEETEEQQVIPTETRAAKGKSSEAGAEKQGDTGSFMQNWSRSGGMNVWNDMTAQEQGRTFGAADPNRIMDQITEYMKVEVKAEMTELELHLQPESLGTLHIHLSAKEGAVTAQFMAENEAVRAVLEAQTAQLKENLNNQGVKVEAVEVTIASHEFERSFADNQENASGYEEPKKRAPRRIQLDADIPLDEMDLSDEERIAAEMMEQNGNTVDYTA